MNGILVNVHVIKFKVRILSQANQIDAGWEKYSAQLRFKPGTILSPFHSSNKWTYLAFCFGFKLHGHCKNGDFSLVKVDYRY